MHSPKRDVRICFIGDSFINGTGDETFLGWTGRVCAALVDDRHTLTHYNLGVRRQTSTDILQRWEQECAQRLPDTCSGHVVLSCGINDMVIEQGDTRVAFADSIASVRTLLAAAKSKYKTALVGPAAVGDAALNSRLAPLNAAYQQAAMRIDIPFIDIFTHLAADSAYLAESQANDGLHPRSSGYNRIATLVLPELRDWLK